MTVGAWDLAPAWLRQLTPDGRLVVPLRMNGVSRSIAFRRDGNPTGSSPNTAAETAGQVQYDCMRVQLCEFYVEIETRPDPVVADLRQHIRETLAR